MKLSKMQVSGFKSVADSTEIDIESDVTALVGKNESGKTAVLQALYRLNPLPSGHSEDFQALRDYPRRHYSRDEATIGGQFPIKTKWILDDEEAAAFESNFGKGTLKGRLVAAWRQYGAAKLVVGLNTDFRPVLEPRIEAAGLSVGKYLQDDWEKTVSELESSAATGALKLAAELRAEDLPAAASEFVRDLIPKFQYFDEYNALPGSVSIERLQQVAETDLNASERTALSLLRLAGVAQKEFTSSEYEPRKAALEAAANRLTDELFDYWSQNADLLVELDIDFRARPNGQAPEPFLEIRVKNTRHRVTLNMAERSKGFIWFFSFLAAFSEYATGTPRVILLDEPGLNLHARAQADLLRFIEDRLAPQHQVIYSTHSLFMIDPDALARCRTVEDLNNDGTIVSKEIWKARPETVFPLLGALGVDLTQTLVIGPDQLLVEGPADVVYLNVMSDLLSRNGGRPLDPRWTVTPVGGIDKLPTFVALFGGSDLRVVVLMDGVSGGHQKLTSLVDRGILDAHRLIALTEITGTKEADIEDLFDPDWYLSLLEKSGIGKFNSKKLPESARIIKRVETELGSRFDHFVPASFLLRDHSGLVDSTDTDAQARFQDLIDRLNSLL